VKSRSVWAWAALGLAGSLIVALAGPRAVDDSSTTWWYTPSIPGGRGVATALIFLGVALVSAAWLGLGRHAQGDRPGRLLLIAALWILPLALGPALFSRDVYSYIAQGTILHLGHNPYHTSPASLAGEGHRHVLAAVSPFWRHTTAPYGPLFLGLMSGVAALTGSHLVAGVLVVRALELVAVALLAICVPRLARALGADPSRATWLAVMSPLLLFELVAAAHNDVLMVALLAAGVTLALQGRPVLGVTVCALAATFKLPALAGALFIMVAWGRAESDPAARVRFVLSTVLAAAGVLAAVSLITGVGFTWLSTTLFSTPAKVRLAITPSTGVGWTVASLLHDLGLSVNSRSVESGFGAVTLAITAALGLGLLYRVRVPKLALYLGVLLLVAAAGGPAAWPWYFTWGLVLLAACPGPQHSLPLALGAVATAFLVKPNGILALPLHTAPAVIAVYALVAGIVWYSRRTGRGSGDRDAAGRGPSLGESAPSALVRT
jgi:hypothetical protein